MIGAMETSAVVTIDRAPSTPGARVESLLDLGREIERLGAALRSLVARDDEPPILWRSVTFASGVEAIREALGPVATVPELAWSGRGLIEVEAGRTSSFARAAQRLARDPASVALALRWLELDGRNRLPAWTDVVRRRSLEPLGRDPVHDAGLWFG
jgi:hypothetical protein